MDAALTLYFDGRCALCMREVHRLRRWDSHGRLAFVDIMQTDFSAAALGLEMAALQASLHSRTSDGRILAGIDSIAAAYALAGRGWMVWPLRIAPLRRLWAGLYAGIARKRYRLSRFAAPACSGDVCRRDFF